MPSGRDIHSSKDYVPPSLDGDTLARMRAPPDVNPSSHSIEGDSSTDSDTEGGKQSHLPGTFPGSQATNSNDNAYY